MAWRTVELGDTLWNVAVAAERRANNASWHLVFSFRTIGPKPVSLWATYPVESSSKASVFAAAERIPDDKLAALLAAHIA